ncbi:MAG: response regulator [Bdellovibrio sp. CG12_big_fil_rev_8_21_14_0_65_39_13]|nr:MAG: response regulator [Bdellovibrio sp. CG22_combo_CG10-13_8_21_14_all_39_27]PIQ61079.1 MAG: response regulator [Bdellovibrio sp. CG12_big_fil_rev_8_21_14_0_65_39_13]PIR36847.1 MAG: response regulator [Bdellovibrio sp. CG11_big_fil_rev_8_21_14_0_20_39_38]
MKILIVDDSKPIFMMVSQMLKELGHDPIWAEEGQKAIQVLSEHPDVSLILLDWNMPVMNGLEFLQLNKEDKFFDHPIVMMTTENSPEKIQAALECGAADYIMKPFTSDILQSKIEMVIDMM